MPIVTGIVGRPTRLFWAGALTGVLYAGWIIAVLWLIFRAIRAVEKRMNLWAERTNSLLGKVIVPILGPHPAIIGAAARHHPLVAAAETAGELDLGNAEGFRHFPYRCVVVPDRSPASTPFSSRS